jgi:hypothetical protein
MKIERNAPCHCGSGKKYKKCCMAKSAQISSSTAMVLFTLLMLAAVLGIAVSMRNASDGAGSTRRIWSAEHGHWHDVQ